MGQKTSPIGFRTGIRLPWQSTWYAPKASYGEFLVEDQKIREHVDKKYNRTMPKGAVAKVEIVRTSNEVKVTLHSARPGVVIGPRGGEVDKLREELEALTGRKVNVNVIEIKSPELSAMLVSESIAEQLGKRASFRRTMKQHCEAAINAGAKGVKVTCSGRLAGSEMARMETQKMGSIPLHTLDADVDYAVGTAHTTYGTIGVKVWIYRGKYGEQVEVQQPTRRRPARGGGEGGRGPARSRGGGQRRRKSETAKRPAAAEPSVDEAESPSVGAAEVSGAETKPAENQAEQS
jgi:small subunit ribosomal protein S3